tara:strand:+ start:552 stop:767 length:216 start_codon:yes stop_codon:yes gene_type:complete
LIAKFIADIKNQFEEQEFSIHIDDKLVEIEGYDSMTALMIISMLEEEYDVLISADDLDEKTTLMSLYKKIS